MSIAIVLYALCFIAECVMLVKYRFNIDLSLTFTVISRIWYFLGFAGSAFCVILPEPRGGRQNSGRFYYSEDDEDEFTFYLYYADTVAFESLPPRCGS